MNPYRTAVCSACGQTAPHFFSGGSDNDSGDDPLFVAMAARRRLGYRRLMGTTRASAMDDNSDSSSGDEMMAIMRRHLTRRRIGEAAAAATSVAAAASSALGYTVPTFEQLNNMTYEQLMERFGDGSENRNTRASASTISSLPVNQLTNPQQELPEEKRTCHICLEDFECGEWRKCLPCLHGFHAKCIDQWLGLNGVCPVCKTPVSD